MLRTGAATATSAVVSSRDVRQRSQGLPQRQVDMHVREKTKWPIAALSSVEALALLVQDSFHRWCNVGNDSTRHGIRRFRLSTSSLHRSHLRCSKACLSTGIKGKAPNTDLRGVSSSATDLRLSVEKELLHPRENVGAFADSSSFRDGEHPSEGVATSAAPLASSSPVPNEAVASIIAEVKSNAAIFDANGDGSGADTAPEWTEPTLADLDRSIPQVDCEFMANLIRSRNLRRGMFLTKKEVVKQRVEELTKKTTRTVNETVRLPFVGGLGLGWFSKPRGGDVVKGEESGLVATSTEAPVLASAAVLERLSVEEKDLLHSTRPEYDDGFVLLDCRTVNEVTSWGIIEGAKVLPAHELFEAFHATPEEFMEDYGFAKPRPDDIIICYCQYGPRSLMAAQILSWMGYLKVMHFRDGYYEWGKQYNLLLRRWMEHDKESGNELRRLATFRAGLELQREIAPEFNALPMQEARQYLRDTTRSPGTLIVGEGLRLEAYKLVAKLTEGLAPPSLPGVLDDDSSIALTGSRCTAESNTAQTRRLGEQQLTRFLEQTTGLDPKKELSRSALSMNMGEAQAMVLDSLAYGHDLGASPDAKTSPMSPPPRRN
ncbi:putative Rhodanese-like domain containing protein [Leishmania naiffi]|uniref:Rhodanese-like domain containing protein n=1 Tax=Leishmania naiffi TaxID=5678 RepID=A0AAW3B8D1_9TRYP